MFNIDEIKNNLKTKYIGKRILYYELIDSTNLEALRLIENSQAKHGDIVIAKEQSLGRGQQNHSWNSPSGGLYISIITASKVSKSSNLITFVSGVSCIDAIKATAGINANLKWVNDIIVNQQKLGGILTETITRGNISTHVSGIGININSKVDNLSDAKFSPVSLFELSSKEVNINLLIAQICNFFEYYFAIYQNDSPKIIDQWLKYSSVIGLEVDFLVNNVLLKGIIKGINELGHLIVEVGERKYTLISTKNTDIIYPVSK